MSASTSLLLDDFVRVTSPSPLSQARVFVFADRVAIYVAEGGRSVLHSAGALAEFRRARRPRIEPHVAVMSDGEEWSFYKSGCGCGSPIKKMNWTTAAKESEAAISTPAPSDPAPAPV